MARNIKITYFYAKTSDFADMIDSMSDEELIANMRQTAKDLRSNNLDGNSFGAEILRKSLELSKRKRAEASRKNGLLGGRPRKNKPVEATPVEPKPIPKPEPLRAKPVERVYKVEKTEYPDTAELYDFASKYNLDAADAREWFDMSTYRKWHDRYGNVIANWKGACRNYCRSKMGKRNQEESSATCRPPINIPPSAAMQSPHWRIS
jgi:hypothetical protein